MAITATSLFCTVLILNIYYHNPKKPLPNWLRMITLNLLAKAMCFSTQKGKTIQVLPTNGHVGSLHEVRSIGDIDVKENLNLKCPTPLTVPSDITQFVRNLSAKEEEKVHLEKNREDWQRVARIIDRLCLIITVIAVFSLILFLVIGIHTG